MRAAVCSTAKFDVSAATASVEGAVYHGGRQARRSHRTSRGNRSRTESVARARGVSRPGREGTREGPGRYWQAPCRLPPQTLRQAQDAVPRTSHGRRVALPPLAGGEQDVVSRSSEELPTHLVPGD